MASTRERIITATNELFRRQGYNGTSLSQISKASGATIGSIYHFFPGGKEALAVAVVESTGAAYRQLFEVIVAAAADPAAGIEDVFVGAGQVLADTEFIDPCPIGTIAREVANTSEPLRLAADAAFRSWVDAVTVHLRSAGVAPDEAEMLATLCVSTIEGAFVLSRSRRSATPLEIAGRYLRELTDQAIRRTALPDARTRRADRRGV